MDLSSTTSVQIDELLICFCDIQAFSAISQSKIDSKELFSLLDGMATVVINTLEGSAGRVVKFIGDSCLIVFPKEQADQGMAILLDMKDRVEGYFKTKGYSNKMRFCVHYGEAAFGPIGSGRYRALDVLGDHVNVAATLGKGEHRGRFIISPQAFRKLSSATRKRFHKYTPPIVYLAEQ